MIALTEVVEEKAIVQKLEDFRVARMESTAVSGSIQTE